MIKSVEFKTDKKTYHIFEFKVKQLVELKEKFSKEVNLMELASELLNKASDIKPEEISDFSLSELEELVKVVLEVNKSFLAIPERLGLGNVAAQIRKNIQESLVSDMTSTMK